jgi:hypothetical protein
MDNPGSGIIASQAVFSTHINDINRGSQTGTPD